MGLSGRAQDKRLSEGQSVEGTFMRTWLVEGKEPVRTRRVWRGALYGVRCDAPGDSSGRFWQQPVT